MILGAGLGTRLNSITNGLPKVMMPIADNLPLLERTIKLLKSQGFNQFVINLHYSPDKITSYFEDGSRFGVNISYSDETNFLLNTAGAIKKPPPFYPILFCFYTAIWFTLRISAQFCSFIKIKILSLPLFFKNPIIFTISTLRKSMLKLIRL